MASHVAQWRKIISRKKVTEKHGAKGAKRYRNQGARGSGSLHFVFRFCQRNFFARHVASKNAQPRCGPRGGVQNVPPVYEPRRPEIRAGAGKGTILPPKATWRTHGSIGIKGSGNSGSNLSPVIPGSVGVI